MVETKSGKTTHADANNKKNCTLEILKNKKRIEVKVEENLLNKNFLGHVKDKNKTKVIEGKYKINRVDHLNFVPNRNKSGKPIKDTPVKTKPAKTIRIITPGKKGEDIPIDSANISEISLPSSTQEKPAEALPDNSNLSCKHTWLSENSKNWFEFEKIRAALETYVKNDLFHTLKFISSPSLMQYSSEPRSLCQLVCKKMKVDSGKKEDFWIMYSKIVERRLNQKRSDVSNLMKKTFKDLYEKKDGLHFPVTVVENRRKKIMEYIQFAFHFIAPIVGKKKFEKFACRQKFSEFVTKSDEALALLIYENNFSCWINMAQANNWSSSTVGPKYTTGGNKRQTPKIINNNSSKPSANGTRKQKHLENVEFQKFVNGSSTSKYNGWSVNGIKRFNAFFDKVEIERKASSGNIFDKEFLKYSQEQQNTKKQKKTLESNLYETCRHEMWNDTDNEMEVIDDEPLINFDGMEDQSFNDNQNTDCGKESDSDNYYRKWAEV